MRCEEVSLMIEDFHDEQLDLPSKNLLEEHLISCSNCSSHLKQLRELSNLIHNSVIPMPSPALAQNLRKEFESHYLKPSPLWRQLFFGSVSIPKPILATAIILIVMSLIGANLLGRNSAYLDNAGSLPNSVVVSSTPEIVEKTKLVEVPVIKTIEVPVIKTVKRIVYVERRKNKSVQNESRPDNLLAENKQVPVNLQGFQIVPQIKTRIINEKNSNEK